MAQTHDKSTEGSISHTTRNAVISMMCLANHPELVQIQNEIDKMPSDLKTLDSLLKLVDVEELRKRGILLPEGTQFEVIMSDVEPGVTQADIEIELCVGGETKVGPFISVKLPKVCKKIKIPDPFE